MKCPLLFRNLTFFRAKSREKSVRERYVKPAANIPRVGSASATSRPGTSQSAQTKGAHEQKQEDTLSSATTEGGGEGDEDDDEDEDAAVVMSKQDEEMAAMEAKFQQEMLENEMNEKWQASINNIPECVREDFRQIMKAYSVFTKIKLYKLLDEFNWSVKDSSILLHILTVAKKANTTVERVDWWFDKMKQYQESGYINFAFHEFMGVAADSVLEEVFNDVDDDYLDRCMELARFLDPTESRLMQQYLSELSIREVMDSYDACDDQFIKACRLCRTRRIVKLENRIVQDQVPPKMIRVTGALPIYDKTEMWAADDEKGFFFDAAVGEVYFLNKRNKVDLVKICDTCLSDVFGCITSDGRFDDLWIIPATERKKALEKLREREQKLAEIIVKLAKERVNRRTKDWGMRARQAQRLGQRKEREMKEQKQLEIAEAAAADRKKAEVADMMQSAADVDKKWRDENEQREAKDLSTHLHTANLNYMHFYSRSNPAPATREHPHSWESAHYLPDGTPVDEIGTIERFSASKFNNNGPFQIEPNAQKEQLTEWKQRAIESNEDFNSRIESFKKKQREAELQSFAEHVEYVDKRIKRLRRQEEKLARTLELEEQARIDKRKADRAARAAIRYAKMEANERYLMELEDYRSNRHRFYEWECLQIEREREGLWYEECEQRATDNFWGFEVEAARLKAINDQYKANYQSYIDKTRAKLIFTKQIRPFKIEADLKTFRNPFTGEVLK